MSKYETQSPEFGVKMLIGLLRADAEATKRDDNLWVIAEEQSRLNVIKTLTWRQVNEAEGKD